MIKLNINKLELPIFDVIWATPILIPLKKNQHLLFEIPTVDKYFKFEEKYFSVVRDYLKLFSNVNFLTVKEFSKIELKEQMMKELIIVMRNTKFQADFNKIIKKYFTGNFNLNRLHKKINTFQYCYLFLFIHNIVECVKSFFFTGGGKGGQQTKKDVGDLFYFFEKNFHKNRTEILEMPVTYAMVLMNKWNQDQKEQQKLYDKMKPKPGKPDIKINKMKKGKS
jgi:hypothetical protein